MPIFDTKNPIGVLRDGDSYQYLSQGKLEYKKIEITNPTDWDENTSTLKYAILPSGMVSFSGSVETTGVVAVPSVIGTVPVGARPAQRTCRVVIRETPTDCLPVVVEIDTDGQITALNLSSQPTAAGDKLLMDAATYIPTAG